MPRGTPGHKQNPQDTRYRDVSWLEIRYVQQGQTHAEMAEACGVSSSTIQKWLRKHEVTRPDEEWVLCGLCDRRFRSKYGWSSHVNQVHRETEEAQKAREWFSSENHNAGGMSDEARRNMSKAHMGKTISEETREKIAESVERWRAENETPKKLQEWYDICRTEANPAKSDEFKELLSGENNPSRRPEVREKLSGENNPNWGGGYEGHSYGSNWTVQRSRARERDEFTCQACGVHEDDCTIMDVHHITPFRLFDDYEKANQLSNLLTLCRPCHVAVERGEN